MRVRVCAVAIVSLLIWLSHFLQYEEQIFSSRTHSLCYRSAELVLCLGVVLFLSKRRSLSATEWTATFAFTGLVLAHAAALLVVREDCLIPMTLTMEWGQMVIALAALLSFWPTVTLLTTTWVVGTLVTAYRSQWDTDFSDHLVLLVIYAVVLTAVRAFDRLRRREFVARERLDLANTELRKAEQARSWLFVNLSHDLRTPLALIHAEAELLQRQTSAEQRAQGLQRVRTNAAALAELTNELLELSRLEAGKTPVEATNIDLWAIAEQVAAQFQGPNRVVRVRVASETRAPLGVFADVGHVRRIITNLVANAVRASASEVLLESGTDSQGVWLDVIDDGPGIPSERRALIFERFTSFETAGSVAAGIGLPVARELCALNSGSLELLEGAERTTFRVRLPHARAALSEVPTQALRSHSAPQQVVEPRPARHDLRASDSTTADDVSRSLLVIEDHPEMRRLLCELLSPYFSLQTASSAAEAERTFANDPPSAILCDIMLPDGNGFAILEKLRSLQNFDGVPLLFISALADVEQRARGLRLGADDYITKPFSADELLARVNAACKRAEERQRALESQRQDFMAELHDGVTASLSRAALLLSAAKNKGQSEELISHAHSAVSEGLEEARTILSLIDAGTVGVNTTAAAIEEDFETSAESFALEHAFHIRSDGSVSLLSAVEAHTLRRVVREAVTNSVKHARATRLEAFLVLNDGKARLRIQDDGAYQSKPGDGSGRGLAILKRRVARLGGIVTLGESPSGGRYVEVEFPLRLSQQVVSVSSLTSATARQESLIALQ